MPTVIEQHGITGVVAVFHRQTAGPVQGSGRRVSWTRDTEAQSGGVGPGPPGEQASFTVINKGDAGGPRVERRVLVGVQGVGKRRI